MTVTAPELTPTEAAPGTTWRRLDPRMLVVHPMKEVARALPALLGVAVAGRNGGGGIWTLVATAVMVGIGLLRWATTTYRITPTQVQLRRGLLRRRTLAVPLDRVRTVDVTAHALHRVLGLARVVVGTGRSDEKKDRGIVLDSLTAPSAAQLRDELLHHRTDGQPAAATSPTPGRTLARFELRWIRYGAFSLSGLFTVGAVSGLLAQFLNEAHLSPGHVGPVRSAADRLARMPLGLAASEVVLAAVAIVSTIGYVLAFWGFRLTRQEGGTLHVTRGLVTTRATTIEERRLRGVELSEPLVLRAVRGARCIGIATGLRVGRGSDRGGSMLLPPAPRAEAQRVATTVLGLECPVTVGLTGHGPVATRRRFTRALGAAGLPVAVVALLWGLGVLPGWSLLCALGLLLVAALLAFDRSRSLGHTLVDGYLVSRWGSVVRRRYALACAGVIGVNLRRSFFQRRAGVATLTATTAAGRQGYRVPDLAAADAVALADAVVPGLLTPFLEAAHRPAS